MRTGRFSSHLGQEKIYYRASTHSTEEPAKEVFLIIHDLLDYHERYLEIHQYTTIADHQNFQYYWIDLKGHGLSSGIRGHVNYFDEFCFDVVQMILMISNEQKTKITLMGQGLGALIILKLMNPYGSFSAQISSYLKGLIFINPLLHFNYQWPKWSGLGIKKLLPTIDRIKFAPKIKGHQLCTDLELAQNYDHSPLILSQISIGFLSEVLEAGVDVKRLSYFIDLPSLFLVSEDDFLISAEQIYLYQKGLPKEASTFISYPAAKHDLLNDKSRELVFNDIIHWLKCLP